MFNFHNYDNLKHTERKVDPCRRATDVQGQEVMTLLFAAYNGDLHGLKRQVPQNFHERGTPIYPPLPMAQDPSTLSGPFHTLQPWHSLGGIREFDADKRACFTEEAEDVLITTEESFAICSSAKGWKLPIFQLKENTGKEFLCAMVTSLASCLCRLSMSGIDMSQADYDGRTALHLCAAEGHANCVKFLLQKCQVPLYPKDR